MGKRKGSISKNGGLLWHRETAYFGAPYVVKKTIANSPLGATILEVQISPFSMLCTMSLSITYPKISGISQKLWRPEADLRSSFYYIKYAISLCKKSAAGLDRRSLKRGFVAVCQRPACKTKKSLLLIKIFGAV